MTITMKTFFGKRETGSERLRLRIFNVLPAAGYQMDRLMQLMDLVESDRSPTACVECRAKPRMHLNPDFLEEHCRLDEHLFMLVMHELYHVVLGHTTLFERHTPLHNFVFDAVINAMLCREFTGKAYIDFFCNLYDSEKFPERLLRPPRGWDAKGTTREARSHGGISLKPDPIQFPKDAELLERKAMELLYGGSSSGGSVTYLDVFRAVVKMLGEKVGEEADWDKLLQGVLLVGDHDGDGMSGLNDDEVLNDESVMATVRKIVEDWPPPDKPLAGRDSGGDPKRFLLDAQEDPGVRFRFALRKLLGKAGILKSGGSSRKLTVMSDESRDLRTPLPRLEDRRAIGMEMALGFRPLYFEAQENLRRRRLVPRDVAFVYLDVSGSMYGVLPKLTAALREPHRKGEVRLFVFSTVVDEVQPRIPFEKQPLQNTGGTDIACVFTHLAAIPKGETPRRVVLLTDGYVGHPVKSDLRICRLRKVKLYAGLVDNPYVGDLQDVADEIHYLPPFK